MKVVLQRVNHASVLIDNQEHSSIEKGILILLGVEVSDTPEDVLWLSAKIVNLRIFNDENGLMNLSVKEIEGEILVVSQFTLHAKTKKGNRPSFIDAARPEFAVPLYEMFIDELQKELGKPIKSGVFGADMNVVLSNNGPVTIIIDSKNKS
jgi:D-aminoacyl-tRNA deacylase